MSRHIVGSVADFTPNQVKVVRISGERVGVVLYEGKFYAFEDRCTHDDGPLGEGELEGCQIECPRHGARFDIRTGRVMAPPAFSPLEIYPTEQEADHIYVTLPD